VKFKLIAFVLLVLFFFQTNYALAIPGFKKYKIKPGDTYVKICQKELHEFNHELLNLLMKINRIDEKHLIPKQIIYLPIDMELAHAYCPLPKLYHPLAKHPRGIYINLSKQYFGAYEFGKLIFWGPISSGKKGKETPTGNFHVIKKEKDKISSICGKSMYYSLQFSGHYFMHHQSLKGKPSSLGCIRTLYDDAKRLYYWIKINDRIIIKKDTLAASR